MRINKMVKEVHSNAVIHGWWEEDRSFGELIALCHSELSEALEEYRNGKRPEQKYYKSTDGTVWIENLTKTLKPEGVPSELADTVIRIMDMCGYYGIDLETAIVEKMEYNKTRPYKHGGKVI